MFTRQGYSPGVSFPRIIGIECVGVIVAHGNFAPDATRPPIGTRVATCMGGLGRQIPGSYAEYVCVSAENVRALPAASLPIETLASLPEMLQTTYGALVQGLDLKRGESLLIRGATSSIGICAIQMARYLGVSRIGATTRNEKRKYMLKSYGVDEVYVDSGNIRAEVVESTGGRFDKVLELVGTTTLRDSLKCAVERGTVCMTGIQGGEWEVSKFAPFEDLPNRVRLSVYSGGSDDFRACPWDELVQAVEDGKIKIPTRAFSLDEIQKVHGILESGGGGEKLVVIVSQK
ncbi:zinc-binding alcohol dehydrogenase domain-containing protein 2 [Colletotrichum salicis]|uniref:Zinc-binding alcohol dehydrogenase domain-containing protein 2 n=1 Tax=Colletotrichum salicis TaxID=1209931 RepID=A0A135V5B5_9PEZI|nr:zinc-binding alcohol dehydrogenase domain-containing protein 2 [Colletotrichum salicis]